jgi:hypothetical protein
MDTPAPLHAGLFLEISVAPAISCLPADILQSRKKVFEFTSVFVRGGVDRCADHADAVCTILRSSTMTALSRTMAAVVGSLNLNPGKRFKFD